MYFSWQKRRIITELAVWAARQGEASQFVYTLADAVTERVGAGELDAPGEPTGIGIRRNADPVEIDEEDRRLRMYFCHPTGDTGTFAGHPVDYKLLAPGAPVEGNRAFRSSVQDADGILLIAAGGDDADPRNADAVEALARFADLGDRDPPVPLHILLPPAGTDRLDPDAFRRRHELPDAATVRTAEPWRGDAAWSEFLELADATHPRLRAAADEGRLPNSD